MPATKRRKREVTTRAERALLQDNHQPEQTEARAPHEQQEHTASSIPGSSSFEFDARDLAWLRLVSFLLTEQATSPVLESIPFSEDAESRAVHEAVTEDDEPLATGPLTRTDTRPPWPARPRAWLLVSAGLVSVGLLLLLGLLLAAPLLAPTATVAILPQATTLSTTTTLTIVTVGTPDPAHAEIAGRRLSTLTLSQAQTIPTTGLGHQDARAAHGLVTFYNALPEVQTIPAGTLLVGADGVEVVTDQQAVLPAAIPPTDGQMSVVAHAIRPGPGGNIEAGDIHGPCCRAYVLAQNQAAFTGGQDARMFPMLSQHDLDEAVDSLTASRGHSVRAAFSAQLQAGEALPKKGAPQAQQIADRFHLGTLED